MKTTTAPSTNYPIHTVAAGDQMTLCGYSDRVSYTVISATRTTLTLQENSRTLLNGVNSNEPDKLTFTAGGFCGHTEGTQRYEVKPNPNGHIIKAHLRRKTRKTWTKGTDGEYSYIMKPDFRNGASYLIEGQHDHYDFNF